MTLYQPGFIEFLKGTGEERFGPRQENSYKSCLLRQITWNLKQQLVISHLMKMLTSKIVLITSHLTTNGNDNSHKKF